MAKEVTGKIKLQKVAACVGEDHRGNPMHPPLNPAGSIHRTEPFAVANGSTTQPDDTSCWDRVTPLR